MWQGQIDITAGQMRFCVIVLLSVYSMLVKSVYVITTIDKFSFAVPRYTRLMPLSIACSLAGMRWW